MSRSETSVPRGGEMLSATEIAGFCAQISMIMNSGISVAEGLSIMIEDAAGQRDKELLAVIHAQVDAGNSFHAGLLKAGCFPKYMLDMAMIGERTGRLDTVMSALSAYYERQEAISRSIRHAVTYPLIMVGMMMVVFIVLIVQVLPVFNQVFEQLGAEMTGLSRSMLNLGRVIGQYSFGLIIAAAVLVAAFFVVRATDGGRRLFERLKTALFRGLSGKIASERFASAMSMMMKSGLDIDQSLDMAYQLVDNDLARQKIHLCRERMQSGVSFSEALVEAGIFSGVHARMISIGFKTGAADSVMDRLAVVYEEEIDSRLSNAIAVLEPTLVAVLSVVVGMILLSVMLPLMGIMSSIG